MENITKKYYENILKNMKSIQEIVDFCKDKDFCKKNKELIFKIILNIYNYNTSFDNFNYSLLFKELDEASIKKSFSQSNKEYLNAHNKDIQDYISQFGSNNLKKFLELNNIYIQDTNKLISRKSIPLLQIIKSETLNKPKRDTLILDPSKFLNIPTIRRSSTQSIPESIRRSSTLKQISSRKSSIDDSIRRASTLKK